MSEVAVAAQVGRHHGEVLGEDGGHLVPGGVGLRVAMQQEKRRAAAADGTAEAHGGGLDVMRGETRDQAGRQRHGIGLRD